MILSACMKKEHSCSICGVSVFRYDCQLKKSKTVFCSKACVGAAKRNGSELNCHHCGKAFYRRFGEQDIGDRVHQFCSRDCYFTNRDNGKSYKRISGRHLHRIVAEAKLGRALLPGEVVHHKDENKRNNHPDNLEVLPSQSVHAKLHAPAMVKAKRQKRSLL
jgi:hypothetical protein